MKKENILVTGGTGFIGYNILRRLAKSKLNLYSLSTKKPKKNKKIKKVKYIICDIRKKKSLYKKIDLNFRYVINLCGYVDHKKKVITLQSHFHGCKNLVNFFKNKNLKNFIQIGSSLEYGLSSTPNKESSLCSPRGNYGFSKYMASKHVIKTGKKDNLSYTILRLYQIYGPHQTINRLIPLTIDACLKNKKFPCSKGEQKRDFLYIEDLVDLIIKILKTKASNEIYNVGSGRPIKIKQVINIIKSSIGLGNPEFGKIKMRKDEIKNSYPNISKVRNKFKWIPKINFRKGIKNTIKFYANKKN